MQILEDNWKWVVVFGAFMVHVICDGISYAFGLILVELLASFHEGIALTSWITSILIGMTLGSGPIAGSLANHFGCRKVVIAGSIIASVGSGISYFATGILFLVISVGVIMGFGFSLMFCPSVIVVNMYFKKKRALAVGIVVCGAGVGTFIFAPFSAYLLDTYSWRGTFLIYSALILNGVLFGALFRIPPSMKRVLLTRDESNPDDKTVAHDNSSANNSRPPSAAANGPPIKAENGAASNGIQVSSGDVMNGVVPSSLLKLPKKSSLTALKLQDAQFSNSESMLANVKTARFHPESVNHHESSIDRKRCFSTMTVDEYKTNKRHRHRTTTEAVYDVYLPLMPLERKDIFHSGMTIDLDGTPSSRKESNVRTKTTKLREDGDEDVSEEFEMEHSRPKGFWKSCIWGLKSLVSVSLLKDPVFLVIALSNLLTNIGYDLPRIFLPDKAEEEFGISKSAASWLLSIWGIFNTLGRVLVGYICDRKWAIHKRLWIYNISLIFAGLVNLLSPFCTNYISLAVYSALFGFSLSTYISLTSVVLVDLLGIDRLTNAFGLLLFFQGLGAIVGPPIGGLLVDENKNYNWSFIFAGIVLFVSGAMLMPIAYSKQSTRKRTKSERLAEEKELEGGL